MDDLRLKLAEPFEPDEIHWRVGATNRDKTRCLPLAYIDARAVMDRLDDVCGIDGWQDSYTIENGRTVCALAIRFGRDWIVKQGVAGDTDVEAIKGAESDALKRAAVKWGVARYLYSLKSGWVELENSQIPEAALKKLADQHEVHAQKFGWGGPAECAVLKFALRAVQLFVKTPEDAKQFRDDNRGMLPQLRVKHRDVIEKALQFVEDGQKEQAA